MVTYILLNYINELADRSAVYMMSATVCNNQGGEENLAFWVSNCC